MKKTYIKWSDNDLDFIRQNYEKLTDKDMSETLSKISGISISIGMIRRQRRKLQLGRKRGRPKSVIS
jgi:hypothetical protein